MQKNHLLVGLVALLWVLTSCRTSRTDEQRRATTEAEEMAQAQSTSLTNAIIEAGDDEQAEALRSEQLAYRARLEHALNELDRELAKARTDVRRGKGRVKELQGRRETFKHDLDAIDRSTAQDWAGLRGTIDRHFRDESNMGGAR